MISRFFLVILVGLLGGCASSPNKRSTERSVDKPPAMVEGTTITEPNIGYRGLVIPLPPHYERITPLPKGTPSYNNGQWAWSMATDYDKNPGNHSLEHIAFAHEDLGITVTFLQLHLMIDETAFKANERAIMDVFTKAFEFPAGEKITRETKKLGEHWVSCFGRNLPAPHYRYNAVYEFLIPPSRKVVINGVSSILQKDLLIAGIEATIARIKPLKP